MIYKVKEGDFIDYVEATKTITGTWGVCTNVNCKVLCSYGSGLVTVVEPVNNELVRIHQRQIVKKYKKLRTFK